MKTFETREDAKRVAEELGSSTIYRLRHGEYDRPKLTARKVRGEEKYYIHAHYYFYEGTIGAIQDHALTEDDLPPYLWD